MAKPYIGLLDCNNFFVSCERLFRPELIDKPVIVLSSNDGCVVARSKEVKDMGIPMGVPYFQIKDIIKKERITTFSSHLALYRDISRRVFTIMREELGIVQQYSIDEAFFELDSEPEQVSRRVKEAVERQVGIPVSIGVASSKTRAKFANLLAKKGSGVCVIDDERWATLAPGIPLSKIWGVGGKSEISYKKQGLKTVADFSCLDRDRVRTLFGVTGIRLQEELQGKPVFAVRSSLESQKSLLSSRSFKKEALELSVLADAVAYHIRHVAKDLRSMDMQTLSIRVFIKPSRYGDFLLRGGSKEAILTLPTNNTLDLLKTGKELLEDIYEADVPYKKVGVTLSKLCPANSGQNNLFDIEDKVDTNHLMDVVDNLNLKADKEILLMGSRLKHTEWGSRIDSRSPAYTTRWEDVMKVRAK